jgi:hypothetical protein
MKYRRAFVLRGRLFFTMVTSSRFHARRDDRNCSTEFAMRAVEAGCRVTLR